jgi:hypothetical protein
MKVSFSIDAPEIKKAVSLKPTACNILTAGLKEMPPVINKNTYTGRHPLLLELRHHQLMLMIFKSSLHMGR